MKLPRIRTVLLTPVMSAVRATRIGQMIEVSARGTEFENGRELGTGTIIRYSDAYALRQPIK